MGQISFLIKPASASCNLQCRYCFYDDVSHHREIANYGIMNEQVMKTLIEKAVNVVDVQELTFMFQGGEPTLAGIDYFKSFCDYVDKIKKDYQVIHYGIQSNGTLMNEEWYELFKKYRFLVGISLDGYRENHDYCRLSHHHTPTYKQVMRTIEQLKQYHIDFNILTVLTKGLAKHPDKLYHFYKQHHLRYIQLIPCLSDLDEKNDQFALTPQLFSSFYKRLYQLWEKDFIKGDPLSIGLFDNLIPMFQGIAPSMCGMLGQCSPQFVIESDGSVYPCDFYVLDQYRTGNILEDNIEDIFVSEKMKAFLKEKKTLPDVCQNCQFLTMCYGNCKRMVHLYYDHDFCGYQDFLKFAAVSMSDIAHRIINQT